MNKKIIIALFALVVFVLLVLWLFDSDGSEKSEVYTNWKTTYDFRSKEPQDLGLLKTLIQRHTKDSMYILEKPEQMKQIKGKDSCTFIFIGKELYFTDDELKALEKNIDAGANVLLSYEESNTTLYQRFFEPNLYSWEFSDRMYQWVGDTSLAYYNRFQNDTIHGDWFMFNKESIKDTNYRAYMFAVNKPTAFYSKHGKGKIHFHCNPSLFKNYQVVTKNGYAHASAWLKWIPKDRPVVIMTFAVPPKPEVIDPTLDDNSGLERDESYLQFIIQNDALRTAFFFILGLLVLFIIFRTKRKENIVEGLDPKRNMSVAFVETLSSIYLAKQSPVGVLQVMRRNFYAQVSRHFYIDLHRPEKREENVARLIEKTGYPADQMAELLRSLDPRKNTVNNHHLGMVYRKIDDFYKATGVRKDLGKAFIEGRRLELYKSPIVGGGAFTIALLVFMKGLQMLIMGGGLGIVLAIIGSFLLFIAARIIMLPILTMNDTRMVKYRLIFGKKIVSTQQPITATVYKNHTAFSTENGEVVNVSHLILSKRSRTSLSQIINYIKRKTV